MLLIKKLNQTIESKVLHKLLVVDFVDVVVKAVGEDLVGKDLLKDLFLKGLLLQALLLEVLSQASSAKLKLIKVKAVLGQDVPKALGKAR